MLDMAIGLISNAHHRNHNVLICGNGGLAAEAEHFAAESVGKFAFDCYIPCIALTSNSSLVTALANDIGFENVFSHQVKVLGRAGDILIAMTTTASPNIVNALREARQKNMVTIAICSEQSEGVFADMVFRMPGNNVADIQNEAIKFLHNLAYEVKRKMNDAKLNTAR